jgi:hypothetical protein
MCEADRVKGTDLTVVVCVQLIDKTGTDLTILVGVNLIRGKEHFSMCAP